MINKSSTTFQTIILMSALGILVLLILISCSEISSDQKATTIVLPSLSPTPDYILNITPINVESLEQYNESRETHYVMARGISVSIWVNKMGISDDNCNWDIVQQRVSLHVDSEKITDDSLVGGAEGTSECGLFRVSWAPKLSPGLHEAKFQFVTDSGQVLEYIWNFFLEK